MRTTLEKALQQCWKRQINKLQIQETGEIAYNIINPPPGSYIVQLINTSYTTVKEKFNNPNSIFTAVKPGKYTLRIIMDNNSNGIWDPPDLFRNIPPEAAFIHTETTELRANWEQTFPNITIPDYVNN